MFKSFYDSLKSFLEKYEIWPNLEALILALEPMREQDRNDLFVLKKRALREIHKTYGYLISECNKQKIHISINCIDEYDQKITSSWGYLRSRFMAVASILLECGNPCAIVNTK